MDPTTRLDQIEQGTSLGKDAWLRLRKNKLAMASLILFVFIALLCFMGPFFGVQDPTATHLDAKSQPPNKDFLLGSEHLGRDILSRILYGGQVSLIVGFIATFVSLIIGVSYGAIAGYIGGRTDAIMMRIVDVLYALPFMLIVIILTATFSDALQDIEFLHAMKEKSKVFEPDLLLLFFAIGFVEWLTMARIVRSQIITLKKQEFVEAAVSLGLSHKRIIFRHLIPNVFGSIIVYTTLTVPSVMRLEAILSFLGLGVKPPNSSWGSLIKEGADRMYSDPWLLVFPALFFSLTIFSLNFLGDGLRDALDPRIRGR